MVRPCDLILESCRLRFEKLLDDDDRIKEAKKRTDEFYEKVLGKTDGDSKRRVGDDMDNDMKDDPQKRFRQDESESGSGGPGGHQ